MDMKALKVGQKLYAYVDSDFYEATVGEITDRRVCVELANWDGSRNGLSPGSMIAFDYAGNQQGSYGFCADGWTCCPMGVMKIGLIEDHGDASKR
jgi:hypothetical protein